MSGSSDAAEHVGHIREAMRDRARNECRIILGWTLDAAEKELKKPAERTALDKIAAAGVDATKAFRVRIAPRRGRTITDKEHKDAVKALIEAGWFTSPVENRKGQNTYRLEVGGPCGGVQRGPVRPGPGSW